MPVRGSEYEIETNLIFPAIGQTPDTAPLEGLKDIEVAPIKTIKVDLHTMETGLNGVFAGGDAVSGPATVVEAIASGKKAAASIDAFIRGVERPKAPPLPLRRMKVPKIDVSPEKAEQLKRPEIPLLPMSERKSTFKQVELGLTKKMARDEGKRCLRCDLET
jgi:NADPH-dependent glutamate synthase beta subunit-like oxidoreductase